MTFPRIEIFRGEKSWLARFPDNPEIQGEVPLPFTPLAAMHEVRAALQKRHPRAKICFLEEIPPPQSL